jgi:hypothetical protein
MSLAELDISYLENCFYLEGLVVSALLPMDDKAFYTTNKKIGSVVFFGFDVSITKIGNLLFRNQSKRSLA